MLLVEFGQAVGQFTFALVQILLTLLVRGADRLALGFVALPVCLELRQTGCQCGLTLGKVGFERLEAVQLLPERQFVVGTGRLPIVFLLCQRTALCVEPLSLGLQLEALRIELFLRGGQFGFAPLVVGQAFAALGQPLCPRCGLRRALAFECGQLSAERLFGLRVARRGGQHLRQPLAQFADFGDQPFRPLAHLRRGPFMGRARSRRPRRPRRIARVDGPSARTDHFDFNGAEAQTVAGHQTGIFEQASVEPGIDRPRAGHHAVLAAQDQAVQRTHAVRPQA